MGKTESWIKVIAYPRPLDWLGKKERNLKLSLKTLTPWARIELSAESLSAMHKTLGSIPSCEKEDS